MEQAFGSVESMKPETLASLAQQMRQKLALVWRQPAVQKDAKTRRKQKDIEAEVVRGYRDATQLVATTCLQKLLPNQKFLFVRKGFQLLE